MAPPTAAFRPFSGQGYRLTTGAVSVPEDHAAHAATKPTVDQFYNFTLWNRRGNLGHSIYTNFPYGDRIKEFLMNFNPMHAIRVKEVRD